MTETANPAFSQGAIQGPGEFAEGLFLGVRSLVGHTVGGAAGAVSRITGAMGHGLAALSLDKVIHNRICLISFCEILFISV